jgi:hypothetical protein
MLKEDETNPSHPEKNGEFAVQTTEETEPLNVREVSGTSNNNSPNSGIVTSQYM